MPGNERTYMLRYMHKYMTRKKKDENASRKRARYWAEKKGRVRKFDGKEIDHNNSNPMDNSKKNIKVLSAKKNKKKGVKKAIATRKKRKSNGGKY